MQLLVPLYVVAFISIATASTLSDSQLPDCRIFLSETIPDNLTYISNAPTHVSTTRAWKALLNSAKNDVKMTSFYWSMLRHDVPHAVGYEDGEEIFNLLKKKAGKLNLTVIENGSQAQEENDETKILMENGAKMVYLDVQKLLGAGIVHSKLWAIDGKSGYIGSANMDLRALRQVKELGVVFYECPVIVQDLLKNIDTFQFIAENGPIGPMVRWPDYLLSVNNRLNPMRVKLNGIPSKVYLTLSPPPFTPPGRNDDLDSILDIIEKAEQFIYISVMAYSPMIVYYGNKPNVFWPVIDNALRRAAVDRKVEVRLLISSWKNTNKQSLQFLSSLRAISSTGQGNKIRVRLFKVPSYTKAQSKIPYARVNHNKYMVTEKTVYIGTSNWSGDYFLYTTGSAFVAEQPKGAKDDSGAPSIREQSAAIFYRDWNSEFAFAL